MRSLARLLLLRRQAAGVPTGDPTHPWQQSGFNRFGSTSIPQLVVTLRSSAVVSLQASVFFSQLASRSPFHSWNQQQKQRRVAVFWDLDNKPPKRVAPFDAATRLKAMAAEFGEVVDLVAYANHHAFSHVPSWVHEERRQRKLLDELEASGKVKPEQPYVCGVCGAKKKTHVQLTNHFRMLHEREQKKRINRLDSLKGKKKQKQRFQANNVEKMGKYREAARGVVIPAVGYGLMQDIRRAGVHVRTVKDEPQAADVALKDHIARSIKRGVKCICLVSDDTDFKPELRMARERSLHVIVVGDLKILSAYADTYFSWTEVTSGRAEQRARQMNGQLVMGGAGEDESLSGGKDGGRSSRVSEFQRGGNVDGDLGFESVDEDGEEEEDKYDNEEGWDEIWRSEKWVGAECNNENDLFSDEFSESDSEASDLENEVQHRPGLLRHHPNHTKFGINRSCEIGWRTFTTKREVFHDKERPSDIGEEAKVTDSGKTDKPERLHSFFTKLEGANHGAHSLHRTPAPPTTGPAAGDLLRRRNGEEHEVDPAHFKRLQNIMKSPVSNGWDGTTGLTRTEGITHQEATRGDTVRSSRRARDERTLESREEHFDWTSSRHARRGEPSGERKTKRPERRRNVTRKPKVIKVVNVGPRPYYLSGFASESQADCYRVDRYYAQWWKDDRPLYKGKQDRKTKTKKT